MPRGGHLNISVHPSSDWTQNHFRRRGLRLTIADTGYGIPRELRTRVFEPFFTTKAEKGNGLGLWVLQGIIAKHDGVMTLRSSDTAGKSGTVISIFLPSHVRAPRKSRSTNKESAA
jgi:signal transduction histidine kinase